MSLQIQNSKFKIQKYAGLWSGRAKGRELHFTLTVYRLERCIVFCGISLKWYLRNDNKVNYTTCLAIFHFCFVAKVFK